MELVMDFRVLGDKVAGARLTHPITLFSYLVQWHFERYEARTSYDVANCRIVQPSIWYALLSGWHRLMLLL